MKPNFRHAFLLLALATTMMAAACKKEVIPDPEPTPPETSITFKVTEGGSAKSGAFVGITLNSSDRDNGIFLRTGTTGSTGKYKFSNLTADIYYYSVSFSVNGNTSRRSGEFEIAAEQVKSLDVTF